MTPENLKEGQRLHMKIKDLQTKVELLKDKQNNKLSITIRRAKGGGTLYHDITKTLWEEDRVHAVVMEALSNELKIAREKFEAL